MEPRNARFKKFRPMIFKFLFIRITALFLLPFLVLKLWNWVIVAQFDWKEINYWNSLGLLILTRILTGNMGIRGFGGPKGNYYKNGFMRERWNKMSEEEKQTWMEGKKSNN